MKIALIHDYLNQYGGAERVLEALCEIFPYAPIYTLVYSEKQTLGTFKDKKIHVSFLQKIPLAKSYHRFFPILMPAAIEQFDLKRFQIVISSAYSYAKGVITDPGTLHISYCHTPLRYVWDDCHRYTQEFGMPAFIKKLVPFGVNYIRLWDRISSARPDLFIANSSFVASRIKKYYSRTAVVIHPPVDTNFYRPTQNIREIRGQICKNSRDGYYLMVGRLLVYKRFDIAIEAFNKLGLPLKIVGEGPEEKRLKKKAHANIEFLGRLSDQELRSYYSCSKAFIFPQEEDFGITPVEAMACGRPVIAYQGGGALETIKEGKTGVFFADQTAEGLIQAVKNFDSYKFNPNFIRQHALGFDKEIFKKKIKEFIENAWRKFNHGTR